MPTKWISLHDTVSHFLVSDPDIYNYLKVIHLSGSGHKVLYLSAYMQCQLQSETGKYRPFVNVQLLMPRATAHMQQSL